MLLLADDLLVKEYSAATLSFRGDSQLADRHVGAVRSHPVKSPLQWWSAG